MDYEPNRAVRVCGAGDADVKVFVCHVGGAQLRVVELGRSVVQGKAVVTRERLQDSRVVRRR